MPVVAIVTLVGVALVAGALALYLTVIVGQLSHVTRVLDTVLGQIRTITQQSQPLDSAVRDIANDVSAIESAFRRLPLPGSRAARARTRA